MNNIILFRSLGRLYIRMYRSLEFLRGLGEEGGIASRSHDDEVTTTKSRRRSHDDEVTKKGKKGKRKKKGKKKGEKKIKIKIKRRRFSQ